jgi:hypothetical protein
MNKSVRGDVEKIKACLSHVDRQLASGLNTADYAREHGLCLNKLRGWASWAPRWRQRLLLVPSATSAWSTLSKKTTPSFVPVVRVPDAVVQAPPKADAIRLEWRGPHGAVVVWWPVSDSKVLAQTLLQGGGA